MGEQGGRMTRSRTGAVMWAAQPLLIVVELVVAALAASAALPVGRLLRDRSISDLGADRTHWVVLGGPEPVQSPAWVAMDAAFVIAGILLTVGAVLLRRELTGGALSTVVVVLWVVVGVSSAAAGLVPLHVDENAHIALSAPAVLLQPVALLLLGRVVPPRLRWPTTVAGAVSLVGAAIYLGRPGTAAGSGLFERMTLWPAYLWLPVIALALTAGRKRSAA